MIQCLRPASKYHGSKEWVVFSDSVWRAEELEAVQRQAFGAHTNGNALETNHKGKE